MKPTRTDSTDTDLQGVITTYDEVSSDYDAGFSVDASPGMRMFVELYDQLTWRSIERFLPERKTEPVLDAGGGTGKWSERIAELGYEAVHLLDLSAGMLEQARHRFAGTELAGRVTLHQGDVRDLPWPDESFAFVLSEADAVGYCLDDYQQAIRELVRVCRTGGVVIISADDLLGSYIGTLIQEGVEPARKMRETQLTVDPYGLPILCFSPAQLERDLTAAGAELIEAINKPALTPFLFNKPGVALMQEPGFPEKLKQAEIWACEEGYVTGGSHLQVAARKLAGGKPTTDRKPDQTA